jgi:sirohydrochlorin ferrochelatase
MLPYFLSAGAHVVEDLERFRADLALELPSVQFVLCQPLSLHPLLIEIVVDRLKEAEAAEAG